MIKILWEYRFDPNADTIGVNFYFDTHSQKTYWGVFNLVKVGIKPTNDNTTILSKTRGKLLTGTYTLPHSKPSYHTLYIKKEKKEIIGRFKFAWALKPAIISFRINAFEILVIKRKLHLLKRI